MSFKKILANASLIAATTFGQAAHAEQTTDESLDFLNQGQHTTWTERIKLNKPDESYHVTEIGKLEADTFAKRDINQTYDIFGNTPLSLAVLNGKTDIVKNLLQQGANPNQENRRGKRPLTEALLFRHNPSQPDVQNPKYEILELLCKAGADVNFQDTDGETPLQVAANRLDGQAMRILKTYGADTSVKNELGQTPDQAYQSRLNGAIKNKAANTK